MSTGCHSAIVLERALEAGTIAIGYFISYFSFFPFIRKNEKIMQKYGLNALQPEKRLYWLLYTVSYGLA